MSPKFFPTVLMILDLCAVVSYALAGDLKHTVYWTACGVLTFSVTWL